MQAGLGRTSGPNYGRWVSSRNWVRAALAEPFDGEPGGAMLYSTGSTHLLSAILTRASGRSTRELAREWLGPVEGFSIGAWDRDPQGIYVGGNQMAMTPRSLLAFGELYRNGGKNRAGEQVVAGSWVGSPGACAPTRSTAATATAMAGSSAQIGGRHVHYAWGFGGQMLYIVPTLGLTVAMTSREDDPSAAAAIATICTRCSARSSAPLAEA